MSNDRCRPAGGSGEGPGRTSPATPLWLKWALPIAIAGFTFAVFSPALKNEFLNWDDDKVLTKNEGFRGLGIQQLKWDLGAYWMGHYHPLTWISLGIDYSIWGIKDAFGYHLTNLLLHALNAVLFYFLAARLLALTRGSTGSPSTAARVGAAVSALLFAVHPLRVESVAWATERRDVLSVFFLIPCVLCYLRYAIGGAGHWRWYAASVALLLASLLSKAWGMTLPAVLLVLDVYPLRRVAMSVESLSRPAALRVLLDKIPFVGLAGVAACVAARAQAAAPDTMKSLAEHGIAQRLAQAFYGLAFYIWKSLVPTGLAPLYEIPQNMRPFEPRFVLAALLVVAAVWALLGIRRCRPVGPAVLAIYVIVLLPVLGFMQSGPQLVADRYSYVACMPLAILAGSGLWLAGDYLSRRWARLPALAMTGVLAVVVIAGLAVLTFRQTSVWRNSQTVWERTLEICPDSSYAHHNLGVHLANNQLYDEAIAQFQNALALNPRYAEAMTSLGRALYIQGKVPESIDWLSAALSIKPYKDNTHRWLGDSLQAAGRSEEAAAHFREATRLNPNVVPIPENNPSAAIAQLTAAVQSHPEDADTRYQLGLQLAGQRRFPEAVQHLAECVRLEPNHFDARCALAAARAAQGDVPAAVLEYQQALALRPDSAEAHARLGDLFAGAGQAAEAIAHYRAVLQVTPNRWGAANNLAMLLAMSKDPAIRNAEEAVKLAEQACVGTNYAQPVFLNTLSAAYAEAGRFDDAIQILQRLLPVAAADPNKAILQDIQKRMALYQQHRTAEP